MVCVAHSKQSTRPQIRGSMFRPARKSFEATMPAATLIRFSCARMQQEYMQALKVMFSRRAFPGRFMMTSVYSLAVYPVMPLLERLGDPWKDDWTANPFYVYFPDFERTATLEEITKEGSLLVENLKLLRSNCNANLHVRTMSSEYSPGIEALVEQGLLLEQPTL